ncbi:hypothetical protein KY290_005271 [Solanum tuberosum]|uniref:Uncharacterized protein n=1 Tax=Solanum tuberosum TaxID=4113 RepID=A0ABQ7WFG0_SOLTU|nr:hypothetical protein KY284_005356 [Solanum tuberosum]KAH0751985.1 hypothetical protein KY285_005133 [Solanum tuberosum]KAH0778844.1 hypothetical protein KY290_005271 [Solanum tuberosum]
MLKVLTSSCLQNRFHAVTTSFTPQVRCGTESNTPLLQILLMGPNRIPKLSRSRAKLKVEMLIQRLPQQLFLLYLGLKIA